jgi:uncharacterized protein DUF3365
MKRIACAVLVCACAQKPVDGGITPRAMADALYTVLAADRAVYTQKVVNRLQNEQNVVKASEHFEDDKALPLPAQMFRMGAELAARKTEAFAYALLSPWAINKQNLPKTEVEKTGLKQVIDTGNAYYGEEKLGGKTYFTAVYPDRAVSPACVKCHNAHPDSPRSDFKENDVMGGVVIRIAVN